MKRRTIEDYLRTIYLLHEKSEDKGKGIRSVDISESLGVSKPTVSEMVKKLRKNGYISMSPYSRIHMTKKGVRKAERLTHNFRVINVFLKEVLDYENFRKMDEEAHRLEHAFSEESIKRLDEYLNNPATCPKGERIH
ncbi:winged helix-turn-helix transcriptional regulator [Candidatus Woesearchaeota archaeon]|nr:winged helix-turn-helix transcriptional regulator [Candidatus Woesearchaeota archaeon]